MIQPSHGPGFMQSPTRNSVFHCIGENVLTAGSFETDCEVARLVGPVIESFVLCIILHGGKGPGGLPQ
jgi:hypothetical protein